MQFLNAIQDQEGKIMFVWLARTVQKGPYLLCFLLAGTPALTCKLLSFWLLFKKCNVTTRIWRGSNYSFLTGSYLAHIGQNACFALPTKEGGKERAFWPIWACKERIIVKVVFNQFWGIFRVEILFQNLWPLLYKSAELDLRSTKLFSGKNVISAKNM